MGLLNGLSMTLGSRTNMLVEMSRLLEEGDGNVTGRETTETRRLLEA